jgi:hypothetical protein
LDINHRHVFFIKNTTIQIPSSQTINPFGLLAEMCASCDVRTNLYTVDSRLSARGLTALWLNRGTVFLKKKFIFREYHICLNVLYASQC